MDTAVKNPKVTVLMPVYNGGAYLRGAIESVLGQTYRNFELLIVDDGSTDESGAIIRSYDDPRIRLIENGENLGLVSALNRGIDTARGEYVARTDADDISLPSRLEKQVAFMEEHPEVGVCGSWVKTIGDHAGHIQRYLASGEDIRANLLFWTSLAHPSVILRKAVLEEPRIRYDGAYSRTEDYALWAELSRRTRFANIPEVLLRYRLHGESVSHVHAREQREQASRIRRSFLAGIGLSPSDEDMRIHNSLTPTSGEGTGMFLEKEERWLSSIRAANERNRVYAPASLDKVLYEHWRTLCGFNASPGLTALRRFVASPLSRLGNGKQALDGLKLFAKSFFKTRPEAPAS